MVWIIFHKDSKNQPLGNDYTKWKEQIAEECYHQCVYCAIHENPWGGIDHYHIDHYRPKSMPEFKKYELDICNLFYACPICNRFKGDDWPAEPNIDLNISCYPDPSKIDYSTIFEVNNSDYKVIGKNIAANYIIERLFLNRPQLIYERRECKISFEVLLLRKSILELLSKNSDPNFANQILLVIDKIIDLLQARKNIRPYKLSEIRRNKNNDNSIRY